jgi:hypothetical protein
MNRLFRSIWNDALGAWVAVSELTGTRGKASKDRCSAGTEGARSHLVKPIVRGVAAMFATGWMFNVVWAGVIGNCSGTAAATSASRSAVSSGGWLTGLNFSASEATAEPVPG